MGRVKVIGQSIIAIPIAYYGYCFHKACISLHVVPLGQIPGGLESFVMGPPSVAFGLLLMLLAWRLNLETLRRLLLPLGIALSLASGLFMGASVYLDARTPAFLCVGTVLHAGGTLMLSALWIDLYSRLNPIRAVFCNAVSILLAQGIIFFTEQSSVVRVFSLLFLLTVFSVACYAFAMHLGRKGGDVARPSVSEGKESYPFPWKAVLLIAACSFIYGMANTAISGEGSRHTSIVPSLIVVAFVLLNAKRFDVMALLRFVLPLMIGGFLLMSFMPGLEELPSLVLDAGFSAMEMLIILMVCTISYSTGASAIWLFGLLSSVQFGLRLAGSFLGGLLAGLPGVEAYSIAGIAAILAVVVAGFVLASEKNLRSLWGAASVQPDAQASEGDGYVKGRIESLASVYQLTDRERETFHLVMQGKTNVAIAHDMFISEGTVKAHLHHIYQKVGVHTRKELQALVMSEKGSEKTC